MYLAIGKESKQLIRKSHEKKTNKINSYLSQMFKYLLTNFMQTHTEKCILKTLTIIK